MTKGSITDPDETDTKQHYLNSVLSKKIQANCSWEEWENRKSLDKRIQLFIEVVNSSVSYFRLKTFIDPSKCYVINEIYEITRKYLSKKSSY